MKANNNINIITNVNSAYNDMPRISAVFDYIIEVKGKFNYRQQQVFTSSKNENARLFLISAFADTAYLLSNEEGRKLAINDKIVLLNETNEVFTSNEHFGKVIDIYGNAILPVSQTISKTNDSVSSEMFKLAHDLMKVQRLNEQLYTGINAIDLLIPIGKGQRELIIGDRTNW
nr:hypothetical protein [Mycoplasmopsis bovis]